MLLFLGANDKSPRFYDCTNLLPNPWVKRPYPGDLLCLIWSMISSLDTSIFVTAILISPQGMCGRISHVSNVLRALKKEKKNIIWVNHNKIPKLQFGIVSLYSRVCFSEFFCLFVVVVIVLLWRLLSFYIPVSFIL